MSGTFLRPHSIQVWRRDGSGGIGPTGNTVPKPPIKVFDGLPALIDPEPRSDVQFAAATGELIAQTDLCFIDGQMPAKFLGIGAGSTFVLNGITYTIAQNARAAFPDVRPFDVVVNLSVATQPRFLVLQVNQYSDVLPGLQLVLNFGKAWQ